MAKVANFFISPLALLIRAEVCIVAVLILSVIALCAGRWPGPLEGVAILTVGHEAVKGGFLGAMQPLQLGQI